MDNKEIVFGKRDNTRISKIQNAGATQTMLSIKYKDKKGNLSERVVEPYKLQGNDFWGYDPLKESIRRFKIKNIQSAKNTKRKYEPRWEIEMEGIDMVKTSEFIDYMFEKVALSENEVRDVYSKSFNKLNNPMIDNSKTEHKVRKTISLPWNENYMIETYLRNNNGALLTEDYYDKGNSVDDAAISRIKGKGSIINKNKKVYKVVPDQIAVKEKFKRKGIGRDFVNSIEDIGVNIGARSMELYPDSQGVDVWTRPEFNFHIADQDKKEFFNAYKGYKRKNKTEDLKRETLISRYPKDFTSNYLRNNFGVTLRKNLQGNR